MSAGILFAKQLDMYLVFSVGVRISNSKVSFHQQELSSLSAYDPYRFHADVSGNTIPWIMNHDRLLK